MYREANLLFLCGGSMSWNVKDEGAAKAGVEVRSLFSWLIPRFPSKEGDSSCESGSIYQPPFSNETSWQNSCQLQMPQQKLKKKNCKSLRTYFGSRICEGICWWKGKGKSIPKVYFPQQFLIIFVNPQSLNVYNCIVERKQMEANRNKHAKASSGPRPMLLVALSLILRTTDRICIPHHFMSETFSFNLASSPGSRSAGCGTRSKKQDQSQSAAKTSGRAKRRRYDARITFNKYWVPVWKQKGY